MSLARPSLIKISMVLFVMLFITVALFGFTDVFNHLTRSSFSDADRIILYDKINEYRKQNGLRQLKINHTLEETASRKANDMVLYGYWSHSDLSGRLSWYMLLDAGYDYRYVGENISLNYFKGGTVLNAWKKSKSHDYTLTNPQYEEMGVGYKCGVTLLNYEDTCLVVLHVATREVSNNE